MKFKQTVARTLRETVASYKGHAVAKREVFETAAASLLIEIRAGRVELDTEAAVWAALEDVDRADKRAADRNLSRAARGVVPLDEADLDLVVTLGGGLRKCWRDLEATDFRKMNLLRYRNYQSVRDSFSEVSADIMAIIPVVEQYGTFGAAFEAGGFPPVVVEAEAA